MYTSCPFTPKHLSQYFLQTGHPVTRLQDNDQILDISFAYNSIVLYAIIKMSPVVPIMSFISPSLGSNLDPSTAFVHQSSHFTD